MKYYEIQKENFIAEQVATGVDSL